MSGHLQIGRGSLTITKKLLSLNWLLLLLLIIIASFGIAILYSAAGGSFEPWAARQAPRFAFGFVVMIGIAIVNIRHLISWSYAVYAMTTLLLIAVNMQGKLGGGAQRWLSFGAFQFQPSEIMKIALVLALARYFHALPPYRERRWFALIIPSILAAIPVVLVARQPDLGTSLMLGMIAATILFCAGIQWRTFAISIGAAICAVPVIWTFMHDYQKQRVFVFLDPTLDPLGAGYHIIQSKIALGSGGIFGKGFMQGSQSHLNFLPEKHTDFIFTMLAEEFGLVGSISLLCLYMLFMIYSYSVSLRARSQFGRLVAAGITTSVMLAVFINIAMVMGLIPAKGVALPLVSYGGTSMVTTLFSVGLIINAWIHRDIVISRNGRSNG